MYTPGNSRGGRRGESNDIPPIEAGNIIQDGGLYISSMMDTSSLTLSSFNLSSISQSTLSTIQWMAGIQSLDEISRLSIDQINALIAAITSQIGSESKTIADTQQQITKLQADIDKVPGGFQDNYNTADKNYQSVMRSYNAANDILAYNETVLSTKIGQMQRLSTLSSIYMSSISGYEQEYSTIWNDIQSNNAIIKAEQAIYDAAMAQYRTENANYNAALSSLMSTQSALRYESSMLSTAVYTYVSTSSIYVNSLNDYINYSTGTYSIAQYYYFSTNNQLSSLLTLRSTQYGLYLSTSTVLSRATNDFNTAQANVDYQNSYNMEINQIVQYNQTEDAILALINQIGGAAKYGALYGGGDPQEGDPQEDLSQEGLPQEVMEGGQVSSSAYNNNTIYKTIGTEITYNGRVYSLITSQTIGGKPPPDPTIWRDVREAPEVITPTIYRADKYDITKDYFVNRRFVSYDGNIYRLIALKSTGDIPATSPAIWELVRPNTTSVNVGNSIDFYMTAKPIPGNEAAYQTLYILLSTLSTNMYSTSRTRQQYGAKLNIYQNITLKADLDQADYYIQQAQIALDTAIKNDADAVSTISSLSTQLLNAYSIEYMYLSTLSSLSSLYMSDIQYYNSLSTTVAGYDYIDRVLNDQLASTLLNMILFSTQSSIHNSSVRGYQNSYYVFSSLEGYTQSSINGYSTIKGYMRSTIDGLTADSAEQAGTLVGQFSYLQSDCATFYINKMAELNSGLDEYKYALQEWNAFIGYITAELLTAKLNLYTQIDSLTFSLQGNIPADQYRTISGQRTALTSQQQTIQTIIDILNPIDSKFNTLLQLVETERANKKDFIDTRKILTDYEILVLRDSSQTVTQTVTKYSEVRTDYVAKLEALNTLVIRINSNIEVRNGKMSELYGIINPQLTKIESLNLLKSFSRPGLIPTQSVTTDPNMTGPFNTNNKREYQLLPFINYSLAPTNNLYSFVLWNGYETATV